MVEQIKRGVLNLENMATDMVSDAMNDAISGAKIDAMNPQALKEAAR
jgi:hypothetical protein